MSATSAGREAEEILLDVFHAGPPHSALLRALSKAHRRGLVAQTLLVNLPHIKVDPTLLMGDLNLSGGGGTVADIVLTDHGRDIPDLSPHDEQVVADFIEAVEAYLATIPLGEEPV